MSAAYPPRNLFVVWRWSEHQNEAIPVEGDDNAFLYCCSDQITGNDLDALLKEKALPGTKNILLLHEKVTNLNFGEQNATRERWDQSKDILLRTDKFSQGEDFIYCRPKQKSGLLMPSGYLTSKPGVYPEIYSVLNAEGRIIAHHFNPVWDFYAFQAKFHVFDLKENLFIYLIGMQSLEHDCVLPELKSRDFDSLKMKYLFFKELESVFEKDSLQHAKHAYTLLKNHLDPAPLNADGYLHTSGRHFRKLLGVMPGNIH